MIKKIIQIINIGLLLLILLFSVISLSGFRRLPFGIKVFSVQSGSMRPAIQPGSAVLTIKNDEIKPGDIITFRKPLGNIVHVTHRVMEINNGRIVTKGDANNTPDVFYLTRDLILGKVFLTLPLAGYLLTFAGTVSGIVLLIILPSLLIISSEIINIVKEIRQQKSTGKGYIRLSPSWFKALSIIFFLGLTSSQISFSFYKDSGIFLKASLNTLSREQLEKDGVNPLRDEDNIENRFKIELIREKQALSVSLENINQDFVRIFYKLTYQSEGKIQGVSGEAVLNDRFWLREIELGVCSAETCIYDPNPSDFEMEIIMEKENGEKEIRYETL